MDQITRFLVLAVLGSCACGFEFIADSEAIENVGREGIDKSLSAASLQCFYKFEAFRRDYRKEYSSPKEALERFRIFNQNLAKIARFNALEEGTGVYGINEMADWTEKEFLTRRANLKPSQFPRSRKNRREVFNHAAKADIPTSFDWRTNNTVTPVRDQGECGSCWAWTMAGHLENRVAIATGNPPEELSKQQMVDCDKKSMGCRGGLMEYAYEYLKEAGGIGTEESYPYIGEKQSCSFKPESVVAKVGDYQSLKSKDEKGMASHVASTSSLMVGINGNGLQFYKGGVLKPSMIMCSELDLNHAVVIVGYGEEKTGRRTLPYWIIKNSWGQGWGEQGYGRVARGSNCCGIAVEPSSVNVL